MAKSVNKALVNAISNYEFTDLSSIKSASSALAVVSSVPSQLSSETAVYCLIKRFKIG